MPKKRFNLGLLVLGFLFTLLPAIVVVVLPLWCVPIALGLACAGLLLMNREAMKL